MLSVSPSMLVRSSLEEMLDSLRRRDEEEKPKDLPPALPSRPTSKARRPSAKRPLPTKFENNSEDLSCCKKQEVTHSRSGSFGGKKLKEGGLDESPYVVSPALEDKQSVSSSSSLPRFLNSDLNDNFDYFIKKVKLVFMFNYMCDDVIVVEFYLHVNMFWNNCLCLLRHAIWRCKVVYT